MLEFSDKMRLQFHIKTKYHSSKQCHKSLATSSRMLHEPDFFLFGFEGIQVNKILKAFDIPKMHKLNVIRE